MNLTPTEKLFTLFNQSAEILQEELASTYLEALAETGENIFYEQVMQEEISDVTKKRLMNIYNEQSMQAFSNEEIRKAYQLAILKGMKGHSQPNHQMTPDSIGLIISYLVGKFIDSKERVSIMDPAVGTGNLLSTIINHHEQLQAFGVDVDDLLIKLAYVGANLQRQDTEFFHQDVLTPLMIDPVDFVVCDLPVGYYPNDLQANEYELKRTDGHSFSHFLMMEKSIKHTKPGGYLFFLIPNNLFESEGADQLHQYLKNTVHIQGILQLPLGIFNNEQSAKSIFILQKKRPDISAPKEVLLATLPNLSNAGAFDKMLIGIENWFRENKQSER